MEISVEAASSFPCRVQSGLRQALIVLAAAAAFNAPRWFEFSFGYIYEVR